MLVLITKKGRNSQGKMKDPVKSIPFLWLILLSRGYLVFQRQQGLPGKWPIWPGWALIALLWQLRCGTAIGDGVRQCLSRWSRHRLSRGRLLVEPVRATHSRQAGCAEAAVDNSTSAISAQPEVSCCVMYYSSPTSHKHCSASNNGAIWFVFLIRGQRKHISLL